MGNGPRKVTLPTLRRLQELADASLAEAAPGTDLHARATEALSLFRDPVLMRSPDLVFDALSYLQRELPRARLARLRTLELEL